jgi:hypothetical protein
MITKENGDLYCVHDEDSEVFIWTCGNEVSICMYHPGQICPAPYNDEETIMSIDCIPDLIEVLKEIEKRPRQ